MSNELFFKESGILDLKTGKITDDKTGKESCLVDWTENLNKEKFTQLQKMMADRDVASDLINLPGVKPYFGTDAGLIREGPDRKGDCGGLNYYSGLSGL